MRGVRGMIRNLGMSQAVVRRQSQQGTLGLRHDRLLYKYGYNY